MLRWAKAKLPSVSYEVMMQNKVRLSEEYLSNIFDKIFVLG